MYYTWSNALHSIWKLLSFSWLKCLHLKLARKVNDHLAYVLEILLTVLQGIVFQVESKPLIEMTNLPLFATTTLFYTYSQASFFKKNLLIATYIGTFMYTHTRIYIFIYIQTYAIAFYKLMLVKDISNLTSKHFLYVMYNVSCVIIRLFYPAYIFLNRWSWLINYSCRVFLALFNQQHLLEFGNSSNY